MTVQPFDVSMGDGIDPPIYLMQTVFDEGITLRGKLLLDADELLREVSGDLPNASQGAAGRPRAAPR